MALVGAGLFAVLSALMVWLIVHSERQERRENEWRRKNGFPFDLD
jgi:hypothetical protein